MRPKIRTLRVQLRENHRPACPPPGGGFLSNSQRPTPLLPGREAMSMDDSPIAEAEIPARCAQAFPARARPRGRQKRISIDETLTSPAQIKRVHDRGVRTRCVTGPAYILALASSPPAAASSRGLRPLHGNASHHSQRGCAGRGPQSMHTCRRGCNRRIRMETIAEPYHSPAGGLRYLEIGKGRVVILGGWHGQSLRHNRHRRRSSGLAKLDAEILLKATKRERCCITRRSMVIPHAVPLRTTVARSRGGFAPK